MEVVDSRSTAVGAESSGTSEDAENDERDVDKKHGNEVNGFGNEMAIARLASTEATEPRDHNEALSPMATPEIETPSDEHSLVSETMKPERRASSFEAEELPHDNEILEPRQHAWKSGRSRSEMELSEVDEPPRPSIDTDMPTGSVETGKVLLSEAAVTSHSDSDATATRQELPQQNSQPRGDAPDREVPGEIAEAEKPPRRPPIDIGMPIGCVEVGEFLLRCGSTETAVPPRSDSDTTSASQKELPQQGSQPRHTTPYDTNMQKEVADVDEPLREPWCDVHTPTDCVEVGQSLLRRSSEATTAPPHSDSNTTASREKIPQQDSQPRQALSDVDTPVQIAEVEEPSRQPWSGVDMPTGSASRTGESLPRPSSKEVVSLHFERDITSSQKFSLDVEDYETQSESESEHDKEEPEQVERGDVEPGLGVKPGDTQLAPIPEHNPLLRGKSDFISLRRNAGEKSASPDLLLETDSDSSDSSRSSDSEDSKIVDKSNREVATDTVEWQQSTEGIVRMAEIAAATISTTPTKAIRTSKYLKLFAAAQSVGFPLSRGY